MNGPVRIFEIVTAHEYFDGGAIAADIVAGAGQSAVPTRVAAGDNRGSVEEQDADQQVIWQPAVPGTEGLCRQADIVVRRESYGFALYTPLHDEQSPALQALYAESPGLVLEFGIKPSDPLFTNYTQPLQSTAAAEYGTTPVYTVTQAGIPATFQQDARVRENLREATTAPAVLIRLPLSVLNIPPAGKPYQPSPCRLTIQFSSRQTLWRYIMVADKKQAAGLRVKDQLDRCSFHREDGALAQQRAGQLGVQGADVPVSFLSDRQLPLKANPVYQFGLFSDARPDQPLVARLPQASPARFLRAAEKSDEFLSEIYVN